MSFLDDQDKRDDEREVLKLAHENSYAIHKLWATGITTCILAISGIIGVGFGIEYSGWLIFFAALIALG